MDIVDAKYRAKPVENCNITHDFKKELSEFCGTNETNCVYSITEHFLNTTCSYLENQAYEATYNCPQTNEETKYINNNTPEIGDVVNITCSNSVYDQCKSFF